MTGRRALLVPALVLSGVMATAGAAQAVTGGSDVADGNLSFVARLAIGDSDRACSGALVHPQLVLTAASCFAGDDGTTRAGAPYRATTVTVGRSNLDGTGGAEVAVRDIVVNAGRGLVLARLDTPVTATPVKVATTAPAAGDSVTIAGFGRTHDDWIPSRMKSAPAIVDGVGSGTFDLTPAGDATSGVCKGDAGGPALRGSGDSIELVGVHTGSNQVGCYKETATGTPRATEARVDDVAGWITANLPGFSSGFEASDPRPNWKSTVGDGQAGDGGLLNVIGVCCSLTGPELFVGAPPQGAHGGTQAILYSGKDNNATKSYAYTKAFGLQNVQVRPSTVLSYWIYPQSKTTGFNHPEGTNSTCVAVDLSFTDGTNLRDSGAVDQRGNRLHPGNQCNKVPLDTWSQVTSNIGAVRAGKTIKNVYIGYDQAANTGGYRGFVDDLSITDVVRTDRFSTSVETGQPGLNWRDSVSSVAPGGGLLNVIGVCCSLTGPELFVGAPPQGAHGGTQAILYSGKDNNATKSYAYTKAFGPADLFIAPTTRLSYWIYPQSKATGFTYPDGTNSTCVAVDMILTDNVDGVKKALRDAGVVDQKGNGIHPGAQCNKVTLDQWNYVSVPLGAVANGKQISEIDIGYDQAANTGGYRGFVDDIRITE